MRLAIIEDLIVTNIIIGDPLLFPMHTDVTGIECGIGWTDNEDGTFTDNTTPILPPAIRKITIRAFMQRFTSTERIAIRASTNDNVIDIHEDLKLSTFVDLDHTDVGLALDLLISETIILAPRKAEILADGTDAEEY